MEIAISSGVIDAIQLSLPHEQISLAQGPRLSHCQSFEVVSNFQEFIVNFLEFRINLSFPEIVLADDLPVCSSIDKPFLYHVAEQKASVEQWHQQI